MLRQGVGAGDESERDQDLDRIVVDRAHRPISEVTGREAEQATAQSFDEKQPADLDEIDALARSAQGGGEQNGEQHDADAVVEERLARHVHLQRLGDLGLPQHAKHGDRIRRADQGAEDESPGERQLKRQQSRHQPKQHGDHQRGDDDAEGGHGADRPGPVAQHRKVDLQGAGEQQKGEHAVQQGRGKIDAFDEAMNVAEEGGIGQHHLEPDQHQRGEQPHQEQADIIRQPEPAMVEPGKERGQREKTGNNLENRNQKNLACQQGATRRRT